MMTYNAESFNPPAPVAEVTLRNPQSRKAINRVPMLLDSGADVSLVPSVFVSRLGINTASNEAYELMGFDGTISVASVVRLEMLFVGKTFRGRFLLIDQEAGVIGRDILNLLTLVFDGPNLRWYEQKIRR